MFTKRLNGGLLLTIALPLFAIFASVGTTVVAFTRGDATLPGDYHWEGMQLDRDFADAERASALDVRATIRVASGTCQVAVDLDGALPATLQLNLTHGTRPDLDREVPLHRAGAFYEGRCDDLVAAHWHVELADNEGIWRVRKDVSGKLDGVTLSARPHDGS